MNKKSSHKEPTLAEQAATKQQEKTNAIVNMLQGTVSLEIWNEIKDKNIEMFALPDQKVHMHCRPVPVEPSKLYLLINSSAVLPSLEVAAGKKYTVELADKFVIVSRVAPPQQFVK